jgi:hypothetical protein
MEWELPRWTSDDDFGILQDWDELYTDNYNDNHNDNDHDESKSQTDSISIQPIIGIRSSNPQDEQLKNIPFHVLDPIPYPVPVQVPGPIPLTLIETSQNSNQVESRGTISTEARREMNSWILKHINNPFLTKDEEDYFIIKFKLTRQQVKTAFNNRRQRMIGPRQFMTQQRVQQQFLNQLRTLGIPSAIGPP